MGKSARGSKRGAKVLDPPVKNAWVYLPPKPYGRTVLARTCHTCGILRDEREFYDKGVECSRCHLSAERAERIQRRLASGAPLPLYHAGAVMIAATCKRCHRLLDAAMFYQDNRGMHQTTRCRDCHRLDYREAQERSRVDAHRHGYQWTGPEMEVAERTDLTAAQVAEMLGRTVGSVNIMRHKLKHDPQVQRVLGPQG